jgi:hypothetical protein
MVEQTRTADRSPWHRPDRSGRACRGARGAHLAHGSEEAQPKILGFRVAQKIWMGHPPSKAGGSKPVFHRAELDAPREMQVDVGTIIAAHGNASTQRNNNCRS